MPCHGPHAREESGVLKAAMSSEERQKGPFRVLRPVRCSCHGEVWDECLHGTPIDRPNMFL